MRAHRRRPGEGRWWRAVGVGVLLGLWSLGMRCGGARVLRPEVGLRVACTPAGVARVPQGQTGQWTCRVVAAEGTGGVVVPGCVQKRVPRGMTCRVAPAKMVLERGGAGTFRVAVTVGKTVAVGVYEVGVAAGAEGAGAETAVRVRVVPAWDFGVACERRWIEVRVGERVRVGCRVVGRHGMRGRVVLGCTSGGSVACGVEPAVVRVTPETPEAPFRVWLAGMEGVRRVWDGVVEVYGEAEGVGRRSTDIGVRVRVGIDLQCGPMVDFGYLDRAEGGQQQYNCTLKSFGYTGVVRVRCPECAPCFWGRCGICADGVYLTGAKKEFHIFLENGKEYRFYINYVADCTWCEPLQWGLWLPEVLTYRIIAEGEGVWDAVRVRFCPNVPD